MNKFVKGLALVGAMATLASCAPKTSFADFAEKAKAAVKLERPFKKAVIKGESKTDSSSRKFEYKYNYETLGWMPEASGVEKVEALGYATEYLLVDVSAYAEKEIDGCEYYAGTTFKVSAKDESSGKTSSLEFNKYGMCTKASSESLNITITYSK